MVAPRMAANRPQRPRQPSTALPEVLTLRELLDRAERTSWRDVKSFTTLHSNIKFLNERMGDHAVAAIDAEVLENFVERMFQQGYANATIKRRLDVVSRALTLARKWGIITQKPELPTIRVRNTKEQVLSPERQEKVYAAIRARHRNEPWRRWDEFEDLVTVLLHTGGRLGEVLGLVASDMRTGATQGTVTFGRYQTKNDKPRTIPLTETAMFALLRRAEASEGTGCKVPPFWTFNPTSAWFFWSIIRKDVGGMDDITLHTLRHTALTRLAQGGMDLLRLQKWAGHSDPRITAERYTHLQPSDLDGGLAILEGKIT